MADVTTIVAVSVAEGNGNLSNGSTSTGALSKVEVVAYSLILPTLIAATIFGNVLVVLSVFTYAPLKTIPNFFVASLACADLAVAVLVMPFHVANFVQGRWSFGVVWCNAWLTFDILTCTASILHLCAIALDRYNAIHDPIAYAMQRTRRRVLIKIAVVWATSAVISVPPLIGWNSGTGGQHSLYDAVSEQCQLTDDRGFVVYSASGSFYIPLAIMTVVYIRIFQATRARLRARANAAASYLRSATSTAPSATTFAGRGTRENGSVTTAAAAAAAEPEARVTVVAGPDTIYQEEESNANAVPVMASDQQCTPNDVEALNVSAADDADFSPVAGTSRQDPRSSSAVPKRLRRKRRRLNSAPKGAAVSAQIHEFMEEKQRISLTKERRAARTMVIIMGAFVVCWLPFFLMYVIFPFCDHCVAATDYRVVNAIVWLGYVNSTLNPIIYTVFNIDFRRAFKNLLTNRCRATRN